MDYDKTLSYIFSMKGSEHKGNFNFSLKNIRILLRKIKDPQDSLKVIHVAGTNGKSSVCEMISSILHEAGYKAGTYISPHVSDFRERIRIDGKRIAKKELVRYFGKVRPFITSQTFFEAVTAMAFLYFHEKKADYVVCETGLGGRLDATNVISPLISVITNIGLEHRNYLGDTIEKIAYEKAGIIKGSVPVVTGAKGKALRLIKKAAERCSSPLYPAAGKDKGIKIGMEGEFQRENAATAIRSVEILKKDYGLKISDASIKKGIQKAALPGRLQFISKNILVDCAHNPEAVRALRKELERIRKRYVKVYLVFGALKDKDYRAMLDELVSLADEIILTKANAGRALDPKVLGTYLEENDVKGYKVINDPKKAVKYAGGSAGKDGLVLVTGSIYVVGEVI